MGDNVSSKDLNCFAIQVDWAKRQTHEEEHKYRDKFSRDRDRILYSKEFRRLSGKTQVFVVGFDDNCRTRLTHTLEVLQIATTISKSIGLNVELTEAIALGHDVGHTPFGHVGERFLNRLMNGCYNVHGMNLDMPEEEKGFKHNWQSLRVVSSLEKYSREFSGINLTNFTRWGILNHTSLSYGKCEFKIKNNNKCRYMNKMEDCKQSLSTDFYSSYKKSITDANDWSYEAFVVHIADEIAQRNHDIEDGITAGIVKKDDLVGKIKLLFSEFLDESEKDLILKIRKEEKEHFYISLLKRLIVNKLTSKVIKTSKMNLLQLKEKKNIKSSDNFKKIRSNLDIDEEEKRIGYSCLSRKNDTAFKDAEKELQRYLDRLLINSHLAQLMDGKSDFILRQITKAYIANPQQLPNNTIRTLIKNLKMRVDLNTVKRNTIYDRLREHGINENDLENEDIGSLRYTLSNLHKKSCIDEYRYALLRTVCDYIAGMTDKYAIKQYELLYGPQNFNC